MSTGTGLKLRNLGRKRLAEKSGILIKCQRVESTEEENKNVDHACIPSFIHTGREMMVDMMGNVLIMQRSRHFDSEMSTGNMFLEH